ncbi:MAG TPA: ATP-grasp domain-containing protein [Candidatus Tyrphobacter sp.]|nr:ATP-grasp domain-containing protein [Candidatus Tyrphobacter sp.]
MRRLKVVIFYGGPSYEHEASLLSAGNIFGLLDVNKYEPQPVFVDRQKHWETDPEGVARSTDLALIALHGRYGEDGEIQEELENLHLPYWGSGVLSSALAANKALAGRLFRAAGLLTPEFLVVDKRDRVWSDNGLKKEINLPVVVKPVDQGSALGVTLVRTGDELYPALQKAFGFSQEVMIQDYVFGEVYSVGLIEQRGDVLPLAPVKAAAGRNQTGLPAKLGEEARHAAVRAHKALGLSGFSKVDLILSEDGSFYVLEADTIPNFHRSGLFLKSAAASGLNPKRLLDLAIAEVGRKTVS